MDLALVAIALIGYLVGRAALRRWITNRWPDDRISNLHAGVLFSLVSIAPLLVIPIVLVWSMPDAAPIVVLGILPAAVILIGLMGAVMDYMAAHGVKESMKQARNSRRSS